MGIFKPKTAKLQITPAPPTQGPRNLSLTVVPSNAKCILTPVGDHPIDPITATGDSHQTFLIPADVPCWGANLDISADGYTPYHTWILIPSTDTEFPAVTLEPLIYPLIISGPLFVEPNGVENRIKGFTGFKELELFRQGQDISTYLSYFEKKGANLCRVFLYTPKDVWGDQSWEIPPLATIVQFCEYLKSFGMYNELTLITDKDESRISQIAQLIQQLNMVDISNLLIQGVNEPEVNMSTDKIKSILQTSKYFYTSGDQADLTKWYGTIGTYQNPRDREWPRKAHDLLQCYEGGGPNLPNELGYKVPWYNDEGTRPDQALPFNNGDVNKTALDFYYFAACASIMGGGAVFHFNNGKFGLLPDSVDDECAEKHFEGLDVFPPNARTSGPYVHHLDLEEPLPDGTPTKALRIFSIGPYAVVIRPNGFVAPSNWKSLDSYNCAFQIL